MKSVCIKVSPEGIAPWIPLIRSKVKVRVPVGMDVQKMLTEHMGVDPEYVEQRIMTVFLDGHPVDDMSRAVIHDGSELALGAAMPGLVGIAMRKGSPVAGFRSGIRHLGEDAGKEGVGLILFKLFNHVALELGPGFLAAGVVVRTTDLLGHVQAKIADPGSLSIEVDGQAVSWEEVPGLLGSEDLVGLKIQ